MSLFTIRQALLSLVCLPALSLAQTESPAIASPVASPVTSQGEYLWQVFLGLIFVLALIFAIGWFIRRVGQGTLVGSQHMKIVATLPLGTRERIAVVDVGGQQILVGITATNINTLHVFEEPLIQPGDQARPSEFAEKIRELMSKKDKQP